MAFTTFNHSKKSSEFPHFKSLVLDGAHDILPFEMGRKNAFKKKNLMQNIFKPDLIIRTERINEKTSYLKKIDKTENTIYFKKFVQLNHQ